MHSVSHRNLCHSENEIFNMAFTLGKNGSHYYFSKVFKNT